MTPGGISLTYCTDKSSYKANKMNLYHHHKEIKYSNSYCTGSKLFDSHFRWSVYWTGKQIEDLTHKWLWLSKNVYSTIKLLNMFVVKFTSSLVLKCSLKITEDLKLVGDLEPVHDKMQVWVSGLYIGPSFCQCRMRCAARILHTYICTNVCT